MAKRKPEPGKLADTGAPRGTRFSATGHPSVDELMREQGTGPVTDVRLLHGDFWPEEEQVEDFLAALHAWRGHDKSDRAA